MRNFQNRIKIVVSGILEFDEIFKVKYFDNWADWIVSICEVKCQFGMREILWILKCNLNVLTYMF